MKKLFILTVLVCFSGMLTMPLFGQEQKKLPEEKIVTIAKAIEPSRGANPNVVKERPTQDIPVQSRGEQGLCIIYIENQSPYTVDIYLDKEYIGSLSPYTIDYTVKYSGKTTLYAKTVGNTYEWGPTNFKCEAVYYWTLKMEK
jgi:hypothetical protein